MSRKTKQMCNVKPSAYHVQNIGIIFADPRTPNSISFPLAFQDYKKEAVILRSHSVAPQSKHFIDKNKKIRHTASAQLGRHISGSQQDRGRRIKAAKDLTGTKQKLVENQINLCLLSSQGNVRDTAEEIKNMVNHQNSHNRQFNFCISENSKSDFDNAKMANSTRFFNMEKSDYESKNKSQLRFATFDNNPGPDPNLEYDSAAAGLKLLSLKQQSEPFPKKYTTDCPDRLKHKLGFTTENSFTSSSSEEKYKKPRTSTESSDFPLFDDNLFENQWLEVKPKNEEKSFNYKKKPRNF
jgi:hypothetical protein